MNKGQPKPGQKCCGNCLWSKFAEDDKTPTGKWKRDAIGRCTYTVVWPPVPPFLVRDLPKKYPAGYSCWSDGRCPSDGGDCPVFESSEK